MSQWADVFLGVIAVTLLVSVTIQIGVLLLAARLARRVERLSERVETELKPLFGHLDTIGREATRAASLATAQVERADVLFSEAARRVQQTFDTLQASVSGPAREGVAVLRGLRAAVQALRGHKSRRPRPRAEDEDALFI